MAVEHTKLDMPKTGTAGHEKTEQTWEDRYRRELSKTRVTSHPAGAWLVTPYGTVVAPSFKNSAGVETQGGAAISEAEGESLTAAEVTLEKITLTTKQAGPAVPTHFIRNARSITGD